MLENDCDWGWCMCTRVHAYVCVHVCVCVCVLGMGTEPNARLLFLKRIQSLCVPANSVPKALDNQDCLFLCKPCLQQTRIEAPGCLPFLKPRHSYKKKIFIMYRLYIKVLILEESSCKYEKEARTFQYQKARNQMQDVFSALHRCHLWGEGHCLP